ncbi:DUF3040 domain-containing protein [Streptomyces sp. HUAS TT20]|uniref:DUF3040 domain-containing protein n=1 Tax=Streptomyces sp. HUAS TT20 TaxID=3447509 RepID=UPI0021D9EBC6|nr:DUF3040 domain-containing protein [Streptomyces sp. HUAS 15-9]UXY32880.1 DUF3040 domain-containing protein [Streptomyces sp. HUAS 15-9]
MEDGDASKKVRLSPYERFAPAHIKAELRYDHRFTCRTSGRAPCTWLRLAVALMTAASVFLAVMGVRTSDPAVPWFFAAAWSLTLVAGLRPLRHATEPGLGRDGKRA